MKAFLPRRGIERLSSAALVALLALLAGCGGGDTPAPQAAVVPPPPVAPVVAPKPSVPAPLAAPVPAPAPPPPSPSCPDNLADWTPDDFRSARREADGKLPDAVKTLATRADDEETLRLFAELLLLPRPAEPDPNAPPGAPMRRQAPQPLNMNAAVAIVGILASSKNPMALEMLRHLLAADLPTGLEQRGLAAPILKGLATYPSAAHEEMFLAAAFDPDQFIKGAGPGVMTAEQLQQAAATELRGYVNPDFRLKLAKRLEDRTLLEGTRKLFEPILLEQRPENLGRAGADVRRQGD